MESHGRILSRGTIKGDSQLKDHSSCYEVRGKSRNNETR